MPSADPPSSAQQSAPFPSPQTFDILPEIYSLLTRLVANNENGGDPQAIEPKDLPQEIIPIKQKIAKAKAAVAALPDMNRTIAQQEVEIKALERKIAMYKKRIAGLGRRATEPVSEAKDAADVVMEGIET